VSPNEGRLAWPDRDVWLAIVLGVASPLSVPAVQFVARRLPLVALPKWPAVLLSVAVAFALAGAGLYLAGRALVRLEDEPEKPIAATAVVFLGLALLIAGLVFACVHDFAKPRNALWCILPGLATAALGLGGFLKLSRRGRRALLSESSRRMANEILRYSEVFCITALAAAIALPGDRLKALVLLGLGAFLALPVAFLTYRMNSRGGNPDSLRCRLRTYLVAVIVAGAGLFLMAPM